MTNTAELLVHYKEKINKCDSISQLQQWTLELECLLAVPENKKIQTIIIDLIETADDRTKDLTKNETPTIRKSLQPLIDFIPFFNFFPDKEIERLWRDYSKEKYASEWNPILEFGIREFKQWLKTKGYKI